MKNAFTVRRLSPGHYLVNDQFEVNRGHDGSLYSRRSDIHWYWRVRDTFQNSQPFGTLAEALHDLQAHLDATARKSAVAAELGRLGGAATSTAKAAAARTNGAKGGRPRKATTSDDRSLGTYGRGTRLSTAYTLGRDGKPCPKFCAEPTSNARQAWKRGHDEFVAAQKKVPQADGGGLQQQPTRTSCGPTCVAMIVGVPVADVLDSLPAARHGHRAISRADSHNTNLAELLRLLKPYGVTLGRRLSLAQTLPPVALLRLRSKHRRNWHWAVWKDGQVFDPATGTRRSTLVFAEYHDVTHYEVEVTR
jgi:hypothetical protein